MQRKKNGTKLNESNNYRANVFEYHSYTYEQCFKHLEESNRNFKHFGTSCTLTSHNFLLTIEQKVHHVSPGRWCHTQPKVT